MIAAGMLFLTMVGVARADSAEARKHYDRGMKAFNLQNADVALREFQAAYVELPDAAFLFNIAQTQRQLGQYDAAARSYRAYLAQTPEAPNREEVIARIAAMERAAAAAHANARQPPSVLPAPTPAAAVHAQRPWYRNPAGMAFVTLGVAGAVAGSAVLGQGAAFDGQARQAGTLPDQMRLSRDGATLTTAGGVTLGVGGAALLVGAIVLAVQR